ncbi:mitochondrial chaperone BCS1 [Beauveria bassiana ARSEF 2860]|uniref:Mitochondrial chaperone BCS1 n=1 Tax=Beauveria bassiana (strain ARSEF 2860) TaxID=655819 RepID=J4KKV2_BEAB2|nr:mitochondrial chaperone BCS1 [Beauveria bassiana ARSEF 2860]EJP61099.1 mitochondrial chaperone BCS1 [Beauveria bassiana ARSEF 2860]
MASTTVGALYSQVSFLDTLFPGLGVALSYIHPLTSGKSHLGARLLCMYGLVTFLLRFAHGRVARIVEKYFTFTFEVPYTSNSYDILRNWIQSQPFATETQSTIVTLEKSAEPANGTTKDTLKYSPKNLRKSFWYKGKLLYLSSMPEEGFLQGERFFLSCMGTSSGILKEFLRNCQITLEKQTESKTAIYMNGDGRWELALRRGRKRTNTVILPEDVKNDFFDDIAEFLDPEAVAWYVEHDLLYRRGYLLYGEPGTGKTSLSLAAAGQFGLDIYAMNLSKVNDATLNKLMSKLPTRCILLLEDIDAIESAMSRENINAGSSTSSSVTLSGLLNAIDGVGSVEGRVLIMTTNHVNRIDPAVIRPGRVDKMVEFGLASREMLLELFRYIYIPLSSKAERAGDTDEGVVKSQDAQDIQELAVKFADRVPEMKYSPAKIISFLIAHRHSPRDAVENVISWVEKEGEGFIPLRRHTSTMNTMEEELDVDCFSATLGMELVENSQTYTAMI